MPLSGDFKLEMGFNANGIAARGRWLVFVQSNTGFLFRLNPRTGVTVKVDTGGYLVNNGDGLDFKGRTLYVVRNQNNLVAVLRVGESLRHARLKGEITPAAGTVDVPTTATTRGDCSPPPVHRSRQCHAIACFSLVASAWTSTTAVAPGSVMAPSSRSTARKGLSAGIGMNIRPSTVITYRGPALPSRSPSMRIRRNLPPAKNATERLSGDQNGNDAPSVVASTRASTAPSGRTQS